MTAENRVDSWLACEPGTLKSLSSQLERNRARRRLVKGAVIGGSVGATLAVLLLLNTSGVWTSQETQGNLQQGIQAQGTHSVRVHLSCGDVLGVCDQFLLGHIDDETQRNVRTHLGYCAGCQAHYRERAQELQVEFTVLILPRVQTSFTLYAAR